MDNKSALVYVMVLLPNIQQVITSANDDSILWHIYVSLNLC